MFYDNKQVVVTGGAGFIGSSLVKVLVAQGAQVTVLDNLSSGNYQNIQSLENEINFIQGSIACKRTCNEAITADAIVFHCAAFVSVPYSFQQPEECYATNIQGTLNVLQACKERGAQRLVFSSSCAVYGPHDQLLSEENMCLPESPYGLSKFIGELLCKQYTQLHGLETVSLRYFNVMAPGLKKGSGVVACFERALSTDQNIIIYGDGTQTRDFICLQSIIEANLKAASVSYNSLESSVINVGSGKTTSINQLLEDLSKDYPLYKGTISYEPLLKGEIHNVQAHTARYQKLCSL